ncbi:MAG: hypothetical protein RLZZ28_2667, partial [Bacteroidota bacterium]
MGIVFAFSLVFLLLFFFQINNSFAQTTIALTSGTNNAACEGSTISLTAQSNDPSALFYSVLVDFGSGYSSAGISGATTNIGGGIYSVTFNSLSFTVGGVSTNFTYQVRFGSTSNIAQFGLGGSFLTTNNQTVIINPIPTATITGTASACANASSPVLTITGSGGTAPYTFTYTINGGTSQTILSNNAGIATINAPTNLTGSYIYNLTQVQESSITACSNTASSSATITINPLPDITNPIPALPIICQGQLSFNVSFTAANNPTEYSLNWGIGTAANLAGFVDVPYATNNFTVSSGTGTVTIAVPATAAANTYSGTISFKNAATSCVYSNSSFLVINPKPTASISANVSVCQNLPASVTITGSGGTLPYTFTYTVNGVTNTAVTSGGNSTVTISAATGTAGTFSYTLVSVQESSSTACSNTASGTSIVTVNALPSPVITAGGPTTFCAGGSVTLNTG